MLKKMPRGQRRDGWAHERRMPFSPGAIYSEWWHWEVLILLILHSSFNAMIISAFFSVSSSGTNQIPRIFVMESTSLVFHNKPHRNTCGQTKPRHIPLLVTEHLFEYVLHTLTWQNQVFLMWHSHCIALLHYGLIFTAFTEAEIKDFKKV